MSETLEFEADRVGDDAVGANSERTAHPPTLRGRTHHRARRRVLVGSSAVVIALGLWIRLGPVPARVTRPAPSGPAGYEFLARDGRPLDVRVRPGSGGPPLSVVAAKVAAATVAAEDERFRSHPGVDAVAVGRAGWDAVRHRRVGQGGSTLTQQLVKLRLGRSRRGFFDKAREMLYALRLEHRMDKTAILSAYLAEAPYGGRIIGVEAAAHAYFDRPASQLSWAQAAYLAAVPQRPTRYDPWRDATAPLSRQRWILKRLVDSGRLTSADAVAARNQSVVVRKPTRNGELAPHLREELERRLIAANRPNGKIRTTIDADLQRDVVGIAGQYRKVLRHYGAANVAVLVLDNSTGQVRAWEGSGDYFDPRGGAIDGVLTKRQVGSTIKPFIYAAAFARGASPGDSVLDEPVTYRWNGRAFAPENYDHRFRGAITMRSALASSINVAAVRTLSDIGPTALVDDLRRLDIAPKNAATYGLSLALGTAEIDLLGLTRAYATLARGGTAPPIDASADHGIRIARPGGRVWSPEVAFLVSDVLRDNDARSASFGRSSALAFPFEVAAKTGTSQDFHDNWVVGYTGRFTVGVWVGNFDRTPLARGSSGVTGAGPIFHAVVLAARHRLGSDLAPAHMPVAGSQRAADVLVADRTSGRVEYSWSGRPAASRSGLQLIEPAAGARYLLQPSTARADQQLALRASGGLLPYVFDVDGRSVTANDLPGRPGTSAPLWPLQVGRHEACATDGAGVRQCSRFAVLPG